MTYAITAKSAPDKEGTLYLKEEIVHFGISKESQDTLSTPADIFLSALAACILKNIERFAGMMKFQYDQATVHIEATRLEQPPRMDTIVYEVIILSKEAHINTPLLKRNLEKFGTIYNTIARSSTISGKVLHRRS